MNRLIFKITFLLSVFLLISACSTVGSVDYKNIKSFSAIITDIQGQVLSCNYQRGLTVNCERIENEKN